MDEAVRDWLDGQRRLIVHHECVGAGNRAVVRRHGPTVTAVGEVAWQNEAGAGNIERTRATGASHGHVIRTCAPDRRPVQNRRTSGDNDAAGRTNELAAGEANGQVVVRRSGVVEDRVDRATKLLVLSVTRKQAIDDDLCVERCARKPGSSPI